MHGKELAVATKKVTQLDAVRRTLVASHPLDDIPGWELRLLLIEYPPGMAGAPHTHPVPGVGYVLEGSFESAWGDHGATASVAREGESFVDRAHERHLFRNASATSPLRFLVAYAIPIGTPGFSPA
jgi:quercetin dioxygenase-like cupin family protein